MNFRLFHPAKRLVAFHTENLSQSLFFKVSLHLNGKFPT